MEHCRLQLGSDGAFGSATLTSVAAMSNIVRNTKKIKVKHLEWVVILSGVRGMILDV